MSKIISTAPCRFCGQMVQLDTEEKLTQPQAEEKATMSCTCPEAVEYQKEKQRKEKAMKNVSVLFGEDAAPEKRAGEGMSRIEIIKILVRNGETLPSRAINQLYKRLDALEAQISEREKEYREIVQALNGGKK